MDTAGTAFTVTNWLILVAVPVQARRRPANRTPRPRLRLARGRLTHPPPTWRLALAARR